MTASREGRWGRLEPYDGQLSRTVLRGRGGSNASLLPDQLTGRQPASLGNKPSRPAGD
jgi:hypothetical protein